MGRRFVRGETVPLLPFATGNGPFLPMSHITSLYRCTGYRRRRRLSARTTRRCLHAVFIVFLALWAVPDVAVGQEAIDQRGVDQRGVDQRNVRWEEEAVYLDERYYGLDESEPLRPGSQSRQGDPPPVRRLRPVRIARVTEEASPEPSGSPSRSASDSPSGGGRAAWQPSAEGLRQVGAEFLVPAQAALPAPPHLILEPPAKRHHADPVISPVPGTSGESLDGFSGDAIASGPPLPHGSPMADHFSRSLSHARAPGVANEPAANGPGPIGLGAKWIRPGATPRPMIPSAKVQRQWKPPYSYGYFGAEGKRHWYRQHGYRDRVLQWTLR